MSLEGRFGAALPSELSERTRLVAGGADAPRPEGGYVVYWMRTAVRSEENPALETALRLGRELDRPVFVYQGLSERYPYASDRHHLFVLEGARDVAASLSARGIGHVFHLERPGHRGGHLRSLAESAAALVTECMPVEPLRGWTRRLAEGSGTPILEVDTDCILPMWRIGSAPDRAYRFRKDTEEARARRLGSRFREEEPGRPGWLPDLPFEPLDLGVGDERLLELVAACDVDHGTAPVAATRGGAAAGRLRWERFRDSGLAEYAARRNDPLRDGVSRMSAYLHHGQVSPFRIAREAREAGGAGAEKFLDELLVWRELAHSFCFFTPRLDGIAALPDWARKTLEAHAGDEREASLSWETLASAASGDALWDAAQRSLLIHGELHNNARMTWGKALLNWTRDPAEALRFAIDLNHRYALDGRDPNSYGGLLWCFGLFDRPFDPERPVSGVLRPRPAEEQARRLDVRAWRRRIERAPEGLRRVGVVGGGVAGLAAARVLADHGCEVVLVDKARGLGGRTSTRRTDEGAFDHGAQFFKARHPDFRRHVASWEADGVVAPWTGVVLKIDRQGAARPAETSRLYVARPGMNALARHLAHGFEARSGVLVRGVERRGSGWRLVPEEGEPLEGFDALVLTPPAPQLRPLLEGPAPELARRLAEVELDPCLAAMVAFESPVDLEADGLTIEGPVLGWAARDASKPGRDPNLETWVLHGSADWSRAHFEDPPERFAEALLEAFTQLLQRLGAPAPPPRRLLLGHRWRWALTSRALGDAALVDPGRGLAVCGDWCLGARVEAAWLSGRAAAGRLLGAAACRGGRPEQGTLF